jgi:hypothetical protein
MTRTEARLADALDAAAQALREDTLRPLLVPQRAWRRAAWIAPAAAAASLLLVVGVAVAVAGYLPRLGHPGGAIQPPRYYVETDLHGDLPVVRSTATGAVTDTVQVPHLRSPLGPYLVTAAANGLFFTVVPAATGVQIYRFRLTGTGRVSSLKALPGGALPGTQLAPQAVAASRDGSRVAVALMPSAGVVPAGCSAPGGCLSPVSSGQDDQIDVVNTANGLTSVWQGGIAQNYTFSVTSLSWTGSGNELVYYGEWCPQGSSSTQGGPIAVFLSACSPGAGGGAKAEVWALNPASNGGALTGGHRLFSMPAEFSDVPQVLISPDGTTLTALALTGPANVAGTPRDLAVERISLATRMRSGVLYKQDLGRAAVVRGKPAYLYSITLSADAAGQHWMLSSGFCNTDDLCEGGFSGWIDGGRLVPLPPVPGSVASEAW